MVDATKLVLVAGDDPLIVDLLRLLLDLHGYSVITGSDYKKLPRHAALTLALLDLDTATAESTLNIHRLRESLPDEIPIIGLTAEDDPQKLIREFGVHTWFPKPFDIDRLLLAIQRLVSP